jgi:hypothetical protein
MLKRYFLIFDKGPGESLVFLTLRRKKDANRHLPKSPPQNDRFAERRPEFYEIMQKSF